jgi:adenylosuccinate synthase
LNEVEVEYLTLPGWKTSITHCRTMAELPDNAQKYVRKVEEIADVPGKSLNIVSTFSLIHI